MEVISYRELQRWSSKLIDAMIDVSKEKKIIITVNNQYHYEIRLYEDFKAND